MRIYRRALRTFDSASLTASFQNIGSTIPFVTSTLSVINTSNVDVLITDGSSQEDIRVPANSTLNISESMISDGNNDINSIVFADNVQLQIKQVTTEGTGTIILNLLG